jgi:hypothetical protein
MVASGTPTKWTASGVPANSASLQFPPGGNSSFPQVESIPKGQLFNRAALFDSYQETNPMNKITLTDEQLAVIHHPLGMHARVLAVAGSGKSFTMACRIKHLVMEGNFPPHIIRVLMFNTLARKQFQNHLDRTGLPDDLQPEVHTFHSFSYHVIREMVRIGVLPGLTQFWTGEKDELIWLTQARHRETGTGERNPYG